MMCYINYVGRTNLQCLMQELVVDMCLFDFTISMLSKVPSDENVSRISARELLMEEIESEDCDIFRTISDNMKRTVEMEPFGNPPCSAIWNDISE